MRTKVINSVTQEEVMSYFSPPENDFHGVAKVISYIAQIPLSDVHDTALHYNNVKECLREYGLNEKSLNPSIFSNKINLAKENFSLNTGF